MKRNSNTIFKKPLTPLILFVCKVQSQFLDYIAWH